MKTLHFLSGFSRSGSTLLASILNQNPNVYASKTSPLSDFLCLTEENFQKLDIQYTYDRQEISNNVYNAIINNFYSHIEKPIIIDKHRGWPRNVQTLKQFISDPKIIATYRPIPEVITSYITLIEKTEQEDNFVDNHLRQLNIEINNSNRAELLWKEYISDSYSGLIYGLKYFPENIILVEYSDFINDPNRELDRIYTFLDLDPFRHTFNNIFNFCKEDKDEAWGLTGLHDIRPNLKKQSRDPVEVLGKANVELYNRFNL
jgi:sulfotransferase